MHQNRRTRSQFASSTTTPRWFGTDFISKRNFQRRQKQSESREANKKRMADLLSDRQPDVVSGNIPEILFNRLYHCPEPHCIAFFRTFQNFERHIESNQHNIDPEDNWQKSQDVFLDMIQEMIGNSFEQTEHGIFISAKHLTSY